MKSKEPFSFSFSTPFLLLTFSLFLLLVACSAPVEMPGLETVSLEGILSATPTVILTETPTSVPSATFAPTVRATITIVPTRTPVSPTPTATLEPVNWLVESIEISSWPIQEEIRSAFWQNETQINIELNPPSTEVSFELSNGQINQILAPTPTPRIFDINYSPMGNYWLDCSDETIRLFRVPGELMGEFENGSYVCYLADWKEDESAVAFVSTKDGLIYIWSTNGQPPYSVGKGGMEASVEWSPDQTKLLVLGLPFYIPTFNIAYADASPMLISGTEVEMNRDAERPSVHWITNDVVVSDDTSTFFSCIQLSYYKITGEFLTEWSGCDPTQRPVLSPNKHWLMIGKTNVEDNLASGYYTLYDLQKYNEFVLAETSMFMDYLTWFSDSTLFYLLSRPLDATPSPNSTLPTGLLALDPTTRQFTPLIPGAMYATLNPQQTHVFALLPEDRHLTAALYTLSGDLLAPFQPVTDAIPYLTPGEGLPIPAAWSNDGMRIIFSDVWGDLWLADTSGAVTQLADNLGFDPAYPRQPRFSWSPDDSHLLITFNDRAWVVTLPEKRSIVNDQRSMII